MKEETMAKAFEASGSEYISKWKTTEPVPLTSESFLDLLEGRTPLLQQRSFASPETAAKLETILEPRFTPYLHAAGPAVSKVGISQFEFQAQSQDDFKNRTGKEKDQYFSIVRSLEGTHEEFGRQIGVNLFEKVVKTISALVPSDWEVGLASEGPGQTYYAGIIRGINNGTPIHCDWVPYDTLTESWAITRVTHQAVFNLYLSDVDGGDTRIHDVQWTYDALEYRDPQSYGYFPALVEGKQNTSFHPNAGDLYIFNSRNMHEVAAVAPSCSKRRMAMASFFGVLPPLEPGEKTKLIFWS